MSDLREEIKTALLETLTSHVGAGSDLQTGNVFGDWLEIGGGNLDIEHLTSDVLQIVESKQREAWDAGREAGSDNQANWDGWRYSKGYPITNPYEATQ